LTIDKFRIIHSTLIEHYQFIEFHLEGIYAKIGKKDFYSGLKDVEKSNLSQLVQNIRKVEEERKISIIPKSEYERIEYARTRRNFWCHNCYVDMVFDRKTGVPKDLNVLMEDFYEAESLRDALFQIKISLLDSTRQ